VKAAVVVETRAHFSRPDARLVLAALCVFLIACALVAVTIGAAGIPLYRLVEALDPSHANDAVTARDRLVLWSIRLPRIVLAMIVGALLAAAGAMMQGLFRNPLADPALVGVSSGGALAAATVIVVGDTFLVASVASVSFPVLPAASFAGALVTALILSRLATNDGRTSVTLFLLCGLAVAALANAGIGFLVFMSDDSQLRDITFWLLGSLTGATWHKVFVTAPFLLAMLAALPFVTRGLDLIILGEREAFHAGVSVERLKRIALCVMAAAVGATVAVGGVIGFVGIVVPHLLRIAIGPSHRLLLPASMLLGAGFMVLADTAARTMAAPAELPIGIVTAVIGSPFFVYILLRQRAAIGL
jgi:iron complex transport system permease protein